MTIYQAIRNNSIGRLSELFDEWLKENQKAKDEPLTSYELSEFFQYVENAIWNNL